MAATVGDEALVRLQQRLEHGLHHLVGQLAGQRGLDRAQHDQGALEPAAGVGESPRRAAHGALHEQAGEGGEIDQHALDAVGWAELGRVQLREHPTRHRREELAHRGPAVEQAAEPLADPTRPPHELVRRVEHRDRRAVTGASEGRAAPAGRRRQPTARPRPRPTTGPAPAGAAHPSPDGPAPRPARGDDRTRTTLLRRGVGSDDRRSIWRARTAAGRCLADVTGSTTHTSFAHPVVWATTGRPCSATRPTPPGSTWTSPPSTTACTRSTTTPGSIAPRPAGSPAPDTPRSTGLEPRATFSCAITCTPRVAIRRRQSSACRSSSASPNAVSVASRP